MNGDPQHGHTKGRCEACFSDGVADGLAEAGAIDDDAIADAYTAGQCDAERQADEVLPAVREALVEAHRTARHSGRWEVCGDAVCSAMETWLHFETRPEAITPRAAIAAVVG